MGDVTEFLLGEVWERGPCFTFCVVFAWDSERMLKKKKKCWLYCKPTCTWETMVGPGAWVKPGELVKDPAFRCWNRSSPTQHLSMYLSTLLDQSAHMSYSIKTPRFEIETLFYWSLKKQNKKNQVSIKEVLILFLSFPGYCVLMTLRKTRLEEIRIVLT